MFENRTYRRRHRKKGLVSFDVTVKETNLNIQADRNLEDLAIKYTLQHRGYLESYISTHPQFTSTLAPVTEDKIAPGIVQDMIRASALTGVGPMASVAGVVAEYTGKSLLKHSKEILVENGGDIFVKTDTKTVFSIYAGDSPFSMTCGILVEKKETAYAMCTSSGTLGHSKSFGKADAVTILSDSCALADAAATALGNMVEKASDIETAINQGKIINGIEGIVIIKGKNIGLWGNLKIVKI
ncbi:MAG: UPF0280 family protein [Desulfobacteraceae bacterium]|nr:UPF0280 family protein [Desulfobacteraceae bacterium]